VDLAGEIFLRKGFSSGRDYEAPEHDRFLFKANSVSVKKWERISSGGTCPPLFFRRRDTCRSFAVAREQSRNFWGQRKLG